MSIPVQNIALLLLQEAEKSFSLVNGSYADGKVIVSDGNHIHILSSPGQWIYVDILFTKPLSVEAGDSLSFTAIGTGLGSAQLQNMGFRVNGAHKQQNDERVYSGSTYVINLSADGICDAFFVRDRSDSLEEDITVTLSHNGEVLL